MRADSGAHESDAPPPSELRSPVRQPLDQCQRASQTAPSRAAWRSKPVVLTTNKPFSEWPDVFPHAACVVTLVDRLIHRCEVLHIEGQSYRAKEAKERAAAKKAVKPNGTRPDLRPSE
jgi:hypothetical protein